MGLKGSRSYNPWHSREGHLFRSRSLLSVDGGVTGVGLWDPARAYVNILSYSFLREREAGSLRYIPLVSNSRSTEGGTERTS